MFFKKQKNDLHKFQVMLTLNEAHINRELLVDSIHRLLEFMHAESRYPELIGLCIKDSDMGFFHKDLLLEWVDCERTNEQSPRKVLA